MGVMGDVAVLRGLKLTIDAGYVSGDHMDALYAVAADMAHRAKSFRLEYNAGQWAKADDSVRRTIAANDCDMSRQRVMTAIGRAFTTVETHDFRVRFHDVFERVVMADSGNPEII